MLQGSEPPVGFDSRMRPSRWLEVPAAAQKEPAGQGAHAEGAMEMVPAGHVDAVNAQEEAPGGEKAPAAQGAHAAVPFAYAPAGQVVAVYAQEGAPWVLNAPAGQGEQVDTLAAPSAALKVPAGQLAHVEEPGALHEPAAQHAPAPALLFRPAAQGEHADALPALKVFAGQGAHAEAPLAGL